MSEARNEPVYFHPEQVKYLEKIFPAVYMDAKATEQELRHYMGQQSVLHFIKGKVRKC